MRKRGGALRQSRAEREALFPLELDEEKLTKMWETLRDRDSKARMSVCCARGCVGQGR